MKKIVLLSLIQSFIFANVLILGESDNKCKCDGEVVSPIDLKKCKNIKAINDINICYMSDNSLGCKKLFAGDEFDLKNSDESIINFSRLLAFKNNSNTTFGIKRFSDTEKSIGLPLGTILKPTSNISVQLDKKYSIVLKLLNKNKKTIVTKKYVDSKINIDSKALKYGEKYYLDVSLDKKRFSSSFDIIDKETNQVLKNEIKSAINNIENKNSIALIKSIVYDQYGLSFDRINILKGRKF